MENYYKLLGIECSANNEQIKKAYLCILKKYHPDLYAGDRKFAEEITMDLNIAYKTLTKSSESRLNYDHTIFPMTYNFDYFYDNNGNRVSTNKSKIITENEYDALPSFSFFNKSKFSECYTFYKGMSPQEKQKRKLRLKQEKINFKKKKFDKKQIITKTNIPNKKNLEAEYRKTKIKLDTAIFIISFVLVGILGMIIVLNILHK